MNTKSFIVVGSALALGLSVLSGCNSTRSDKSASMGALSDVMTKEKQAAMTPQQVVAALKAGNERFANGTGSKFNYSVQMRETAAGQFPKAVVLSCLDSRVPPEVVFDQGIGDIFVGRIAGNFENTDMLGSMEFATAAAGAKAIVVLGHTACGAVMGAVDDVKLGNLTETLANIRPAVDAAKAIGTGGDVTSKNTKFVDLVTVENVKITMSNITQRSEILRDRVAKGELVIIGGVYDLRTGRIDWVN
jgi:carbonic anhydrase